MSGEGSSSRRVIPGPAGIIQIAQCIRSESNQPERSTQDVMIALEDPANDLAFSSQLWLAAKDFINQGGVQHFMASARVAKLGGLTQQANQYLEQLGGLTQQPPGLDCATLQDIKKLRSNTCHRVAQVVARIESVTQCCIPGEGLQLLLKDPTGTIEASVHRKVLADTELAPYFAVGSVLVLANVAVFAAKRKNYILNIEKNNVVQIFK